MSVVTVVLVGGILNEVQYDIIDESFAGLLEHTESGTSTNNHSLCFRLRMDFDVEILSPLFSSKMEVVTAASSSFNTSFRLIALVLINTITLANINHK